MLKRESPQTARFKIAAKGNFPHTQQFKAAKGLWQMPVFGSCIAASFIQSLPAFHKKRQASENAFMPARKAAPSESKLAQYAPSCFHGLERTFVPVLYSPA